MSELLSRRLALLGKPAHLPLLTTSLHGIERETLRVNADASLALTPHPRALGAALTHECITTDYSESLLEFVTPPRAGIGQTLEELDLIHRFVYGELGPELLWNASMPGPLPEEKDIPIAEYGSSFIGRLKHVYRRGLALRYGKAMQCIAGVHYNFSFGEGLWPLLRDEAGFQGSLRDYQSESYLGLIRNFHRYNWLLMYLFGASPALNRCFLRDRPHNLQELDKDTLYLPWATSLRMSDLGYTSSAQEGLTPCYDSLDSYLESLRSAVATPYPPYVELGTKRDGEWLQLNTNVIQIENEYYVSIRPKRVARTGERPIQALRARGVQYVEVRCMDTDPFHPLGVSEEAAHFLDTLLLYCLLEEAPALNTSESAASDQNFSLVVNQGRRPGLELNRRGQPVPLQNWAGELLRALEPVAQLLDQAGGGQLHRQALRQQQEKVAHPQLTPSARVLSDLRERSQSFTAFTLQHSLSQAEYFRSRPLNGAQAAHFAALARQSLGEQAETERQTTGDFDTFVAAYQASILSVAT